MNLSASGRLPGPLGKLIKNAIYLVPGTEMRGEESEGEAVTCWVARWPLQWTAEEGWVAAHRSGKRLADQEQHTASTSHSCHTHTLGWGTGDPPAAAPVWGVEGSAVISSP